MTTRPTSKPSFSRMLRRPCLLAAGLILCPVLLGQQAGEPQRKYSRFSEPDVKTEKATTLDTELTSRIQIPGIEIVPCQARVELAYSQRNTVARVDAIVTHEACAAVSGSFDVVASVRDADGELVRHAFAEGFTMEGTNRTEFRREYPIGDNVSLSSVRSSNLECLCQDTPAE